ncbi:MAG: hypothetical protein ACOVSW_03820 [Candidatus Kapaibacteriota bacterium]|jgi:hypothetical protein
MEQQLLNNKWSKTYWFARMLINGDKYGSIGDNNTVLLNLSATLRSVASANAHLPEKEQVQMYKQAITQTLEQRFARATTRLQRVQKLCVDLGNEIQTLADIDVLLLTCESMMIPTNDAIANIPSDDKIYTESIARQYLDAQGEAGLATVVNLWDDAGVKGCIDAERLELVRIFGTLRRTIQENPTISDIDRDVILSGFVQEFERRVGQKRKQRAGSSLEDVTSFILQYFSIPAANVPEHFQADIEVDKWVKTHDNWLIGISCKRTLRERWKQVSSADGSILSKFKIKQIFHVLTYDEDLSDDKLTLLGSQRHIFYLPDESRRYLHASQHIGLQNYVRPMSQFINDLRREIRKK